MTNPGEEEQHEAELKALFDRTAEELAGPSLTRLRARVSEVPERAARRPRLLPRWAWAPTLAGLCAGTGALAAALFGTAGTEGGPPTAQVSALAVAAPPSTPPAPSASFASAPSAPSSPPSQAAGDDVIDDFAADDDDGLSFDLSATDVSDADLDRLIEVARQIESDG